MAAIKSKEFQCANALRKVEGIVSATFRGDLQVCRSSTTLVCSPKPHFLVLIGHLKTTSESKHSNSPAVYASVQAVKQILETEACGVDDTDPNVSLVCMCLCVCVCFNVRMSKTSCKMNESYSSTCADLLRPNRPHGCYDQLTIGHRRTFTQAKAGRLQERPGKRWCNYKLT